MRVERDGRNGPCLVDNNKYWKNECIIELIRDDENGIPRVIHHEVVHNTAVNSGKKNAMRLLSGNTSKAYDRMRIGTSGAAVASNQTNVLTPVASTLTGIDSMTVDSGRTYQWVNSYPSGGGSICCANIQEMCLLNQQTSPGGSAWNRSTFTAVTKTTNDKLKITYKARIS
jgi:hypothetical protein